MNNGTGHGSSTSPGLVWPSLPEPLRRLVGRLPWQPPSLALAAVMQRILWPRLSRSQRSELQGSVVQIRVEDLGVVCRVWLTGEGFALAPAGQAPRVTIAAKTQNFVRLLRGLEDPDRLFFERALVMEGDTEYGLLLKNTLDAVGPLFGGRASSH